MIVSGMEEYVAATAKAERGMSAVQNLDETKDPSIQKSAERSEGIQFNERSGLGLWNQQTPLVTLQKERPEHRIVIYLKAQGYSHREIAEITGYTAQAVMYICRQPWAQDRIVELIHQSGKGAVDMMLKGAVVDSVQRLIEEQDNMDASPRDRIVAANSILDRMFGRPNQPMTHYNAADLEKLTDEQLVQMLPSGTTTTGTGPGTGAGDKPPS